MDNMELLATSLEYIEAHIGDDMKTEDIARECYCSKSTLEKLFRCVNHITVHDYIIRRRMMKAAKMIIEQPEMGLLDIALLYGYSTNESFTRAFKQVWRCKPSEFRSNIRFSELYPRLETPPENGDDYMKNKKHVDISELYDLFKQRRNCYFVCCDIKNLRPLNEISHKAGDIAILESMKRMNEVAAEEDIVFRIGGDEFALLTNSEDIGYAKSVADKIGVFNEQTFFYEEKEFPLSLHIGITKFGNSLLKYDELFKKLHISIEENK